MKPGVSPCGPGSDRWETEPGHHGSAPGSVVLMSRWPSRLAPLGNSCRTVSSVSSVSSSCGSAVVSVVRPQSEPTRYRFSSRVQSRVLGVCVLGLNSCSLTPDTGIHACAVAGHTDAEPKLEPVADLKCFYTEGAVLVPPPMHNKCIINECINNALIIYIVA